MNKLEELTKREVQNRGGKIPTLRRIKIGRGLFVFASLPLFSWWAYAPAAIMMIPLSPTVWAKMKINDFKQRLRLR